MRRVRRPHAPALSRGGTIRTARPSSWGTPATRAGDHGEGWEILNHIDNDPETARDTGPRDLARQGERLVALGVHDLAGISAAELRAHVRAVPDEGATAPVLVVHPSLVPAARLAPLLRLGQQQGFVVEDLTDLEEYLPIDGVSVPQSPLYVIDEVDRGDDLRNWSPAEALPELAGRGRRPLTISEGIGWLLQQPERLEPNHCFMTIASRKHKPGGGLDARTPALWISSGTGRDGAQRRGAPKVGWCWANNRHTWLGFASTVTGVRP